jgi:hypothetical protein
LALPDAGTALRPLALSLRGGAGAAGGALRMPRVENDHIVETSTEARAAVTGHNVRYVLLFGTLAVIVLFIIAYIATR